MPSEHEGPTMALLVRKDLRLSSGKAAVQCAHGAVNAALFAKKTETRIFQRWQDTGSRKVCLKVEDLTELNDYLKQAKMSGILTLRGGRCWIDRDSKGNSHSTCYWACA